MNTADYISSGILQSYVLCTATLEERKEVEKYASIYPEIKLELEEIEKAMNSYATEHSITPPSYLKEKILSKIAVETNSSATTEVREVRTLHKESPQASRFSYWSIAASLLFLVSASFAVYFGVKSTQLDNTLTNMAKVNTTLADSIKNVSVNVAQMQSDLAVLKDPMYKIVELKGLKPAPDAKAMVCWCPQDKKVYIEIDKLPEPPQGMQYQLWAIVNGTPVSEGMLTKGNGLHPMKDVDNAQAFAVTLEKVGGSPTPKGDMYVMGTI